MTLMTARFSHDRTYRWTLGRHLDNIGGKIVFCGVNPSDAGEERNDPTVNRLIGFTQSMFFGEFSVVNPFGAVSSDPKALANMKDPVGRDNDVWLRHEFHQADLIVPMWGDIAKVPPHLRYRFDDVRRMIRESGCDAKVFGLTKHGHPKHPLYLPANTRLQDWTP
jgi:hypothetical protein